MDYRLKITLKTANPVDTGGCKLIWDSPNVSFSDYVSTNVFSITDIISVDEQSIGITLNDGTGKTGDLHLATLTFNIDTTSNINFVVENAVAGFEGNEVPSRWIVEPFVSDVSEFRFSWE